MPSTGSMTPSHTAGRGGKGPAGLSLHWDNPALKPLSGQAGRSLGKGFRVAALQNSGAARSLSFQAGWSLSGSSHFPVPAGGSCTSDLTDLSQPFPTPKQYHQQEWRCTGSPRRGSDPAP